MEDSHQISVIRYQETGLELGLGDDHSGIPGFLITDI